MSIDPLSAISSTSRATAMPGGQPKTSAKPTSAELAKAAQQFEAIMVRQLLAPAIEPMMNGGVGGEKSKSGAGGGGGVYGYMLTDTLANSIAQGGGLGLAQVINRQLSPATPVAQPK
jgi:flagellar protein FlgJ